MEPTDSFGRGFYREHTAALAVFRHAKNVFFWMAIVAVALHVTAWVIVAHTDTLDPLLPITLQRASPDGAAPPAIPSDGQRQEARQWESALGSGLALAGFVGRAAALVLTGLFLLSLLVALTARLGGAADLARACVWSLAALAMVVPWLQAPAQATDLASGFYAFSDLSRAAMREAGGHGGLLSFVRFLVCPVLVAVLLLVAQLRFRRAHTQITAAAGAKLPIHEV